jgi:glycosyltransferase involved in cell wall biosynthesis
MADDGTLGDRVLDRLGVDASRVRFWMNGIVKDDVLAARGRAAEDGAAAGAGGVRLFAASRLVQWKRVDRILDVLARLPRDLPPWTMEIAGNGPEKAALEARARDLGLSERVVFLGQVPQDDVLDRLVRSDVFVSLFDISNLGNGLIESFVAGIPVFTLDVGGTGHLVQDGVTGVMVPPDRLLDEGVERLARLVADPDHRAALGSAAAGHAALHVRTWEERMAMEVDAVEGMLAAGRAGGRR